MDDESRRGDRALRSPRAALSDEYARGSALLFDVRGPRPGSLLFVVGYSANPKRKAKISPPSIAPDAARADSSNDQNDLLVFADLLAVERW